MKFRLTLYITAVIVALIVVAGCRKGVDTRLPVQSSDTLYTEERAMAVYANDKHRALQIIDSAQQVGNLTAAGRWSLVHAGWRTPGEEAVAERTLYL